MGKTIQEINEKIRKGKAVVVNAEEIIGLAAEKGIKAAAQEVDVVTTGTFGPMCSSGVFFNFGHSNPKIKAQKVWLNDVPAYAGLAAVDAYIGCTELQENDPANKLYPGQFKYGGGHVIEDLVSGKDVKLKAVSYGTDCYPREELETLVNMNDMNQVTLNNPRNCYQNYNIAINLSDKPIYTYMGTLLPQMGNVNYCSAGQLSPLLNDPYYKSIGIGTRIFLGGGVGYVYWEGTQHNPTVKRNAKGIPIGGAGTLSVVGDLKQMSPEWLRGTSMLGYGVTLTVGIGVPIPIINEEVLEYTLIKDEEIEAPVIDYSEAYPNCKPGNLGTLNYKQLKTGAVTIQGKEVKTATLSSYSKAIEISNILKEWIQNGKFELTEKIVSLPQEESGQSFKMLKERS